MPPLLVDRCEAARLLAVCPRTIDAMAKRRELRAVRIGRAVRFDASELRTWIERAKITNNNSN
jgi:excisionase family DNA binding protein